MTQLLRELRLQKRDERLRDAPVRENGKPVYGSKAYDEKMKASAANARAVAEANRLKDALREYDHSDTNTVCFLCADKLMDDDEKVETALGWVHQYCYAHSAA